MKTRLVLSRIFGSSRRILVLEALLQKYLEGADHGGNLWTHGAEVSKVAGISTSTTKRILDEMSTEGWVEKKPDDYQTPVKNPVIKLRLDDRKPAIKELVFFYRKIRGFL
ncbi:MAG: hypothetical protein ACTSU5_17105 [Promethearchaeota archaeon]